MKEYRVVYHSDEDLQQEMNNMGSKGWVAAKIDNSIKYKSSEDTYTRIFWSRNVKHNTPITSLQFLKDISDVKKAKLFDVPIQDIYIRVSNDEPIKINGSISKCISVEGETFYIQQFNQT